MDIEPRTNIGQVVTTLKSKGISQACYIKAITFLQYN